VTLARGVGQLRQVIVIRWGFQCLPFAGWIVMWSATAAIRGALPAGAQCVPAPPQVPAHGRERGQGASVLSTGELLGELLGLGVQDLAGGRPFLAADLPSRPRRRKLLR
jgi:hypothetical protein